MGNREALLPKIDGPRTVVAGYEYLCPGHEKHLALRSRDKPSAAVDGDDFPAATWEASPSFLGIEYPFDVAMALTGRVGAPPGIKFPAKLGTPEQVEGLKKELGPALAKWVLARPVKARWLIVHDTAGLLDPHKPPSRAFGINIFVGLDAKGTDRDGVAVRHDFADTGRGVKFETLHPEFVGQFIHVELNHGLKDAPCTDFQYEALARIYLSASYRAGQWLTVTSHREVDRGIVWYNSKGKRDNGHEDPRGFDFERFYRRIAALMGLAESTTFGILQARHDFSMHTEKEHRNTFPVQYGPVQIEEFLPVFIRGGEAGAVRAGAAPVVDARTEVVGAPKKAR